MKIVLLIAVLAMFAIGAIFYSQADCNTCNLWPCKTQPDCGAYCICYRNHGESEGICVGK